jgi:hypothetical protein
VNGYLETQGYAALGRRRDRTSFARVLAEVQPDPECRAHGHAWAEERWDWCPDRRIDTVLVTGGMVFVIEFKGGTTAFLAADIDQVGSSLFCVAGTDAAGSRDETQPRSLCRSGNKKLTDAERKAYVLGNGDA